jgi:hypothetical protein
LAPRPSSGDGGFNPLGAIVGGFATMLALGGISMLIPGIVHWAQGQHRLDSDRRRTAYVDAVGAIRF